MQQIIIHIKKHKNSQHEQYSWLVADDLILYILCSAGKKQMTISISYGGNERIQVYQQLN